MCVSLIGTCTGEDIFSAVYKRLKNDGISWEQCISICTDGAGAMAGKHKQIKDFWQEYYKLCLKSTLLIVLSTEKILPAKHLTQI